MKNKKALCIAGIILGAIIILTIIIVLVIVKPNNTNLTVSRNIETGKKQAISNEDLKKNIKVDALGITKSGDFALKITNKNNQSVFLDDVSVIFKDADGNFMEKVSCTKRYFGIGANSEIVNYAWGYQKDFSKYTNYEFDIVLSNSYSINDTVVDNFELTANNTGKQIAIEVKNNNSFEVEDIYVLVAYYKNGQIVGCSGEMEYQSNTPADGTAYINVQYPRDSHYKDIEFDDYKAYLLEAQK